MATLVFSTIGTALGGPVGGAIGALIGQSFDRQLLAPPTRGPRLGDLSVQSSSYGTQIPRLYGTMRVAGSVIWATDLTESAQTSGAKGQPDLTYSYSVSLAVALSSRPISAIKRIWADGKLLRGAEGDFKVSTTFRFADGSEDQPIDPLIGSIEGIASTPAHRGLALAVFENLELAEYGNRIPFLTFEVVADEDAPTVASILGDASAGQVVATADEQVAGYACYGRSVGDAIDPLVANFAVPLFDDGEQVRAPVASGATIDQGEFGSSGDDRQAPRIQREQVAASALPATLRLTYYDPERDYQSGEARASAGEAIGTEVHRDLPAVLSAADSKSLVQQVLAREWASRDKLTLRLPPDRMTIEPGSAVVLPFSPSTWIVDKCSVDSFVTVLQLRPSSSKSPALAADPGRSASQTDTVETDVSLALIEAPQLPGSVLEEPRVLLAASSASAGWKRRTISIGFGDTVQSVVSAPAKSKLGSAVTVLGEGAPFLIDERNAVEVQLSDPAQWLTSCDDAALAAGTNLAMLGNELFQFADAADLGGGRFRLSRLLRGRCGSEWAAAGHAADERFCIVDGDSLLAVSLPAWAIGSTIDATDRCAPATSLVLTGESIRPLSPVFLSVDAGSAGDLTLSWIRRSRNGWAWIDEVDAPIGEAQEAYRVTITGSAGTAEMTSSVPAMTIEAATLAAIGSGIASIEVRQLGEWAASRPAQASINL